MFEFFKRRRIEREACSKIGIELHRQIKAAFEINEQRTVERLHTSFVAGYLYSFVSIGFFTITSIPGERATDKYLRKILDGVIPNKLFEIFNSQLAALEIAKSMEDQSRKIRGAKISPADATRLFEAGAKFGLSDGTCISSSNRNQPNNLKRFLTGELDDLSVQS